MKLERMELVVMVMGESWWFSESDEFSETLPPYLLVDFFYMNKYICFCNKKGL